MSRSCEKQFIKFNDINNKKNQYSLIESKAEIKTNSEAAASKTSTTIKSGFTTY